MTDNRYTIMKDLVPGKLYKLSFYNLKYISFLYVNPKVEVMSTTGHGNKIVARVYKDLYFDDYTILSAKPFLYLKQQQKPPADVSQVVYHFLYGLEEVTIQGYQDEELFIEIN